jgi:hypothetical protein
MRLLLLLPIYLCLLDRGNAQCMNYNVWVVSEADCESAQEISWQLLGSDGTIWLNGNAGFNEVVCLSDDCYTLNMLDTGGDGWDCVAWFIEDFGGDFDWDTNLDVGSFGADQFELGNGDCADDNTGCPLGTEAYDLQVDDGDFPAQISWELSLGGVEVAAGGANSEMLLCLSAGCYVLEMSDVASNGWNGASFELIDATDVLIADGTLLSGSYGFQVIAIGGLDCSDTFPNGGSGAGGPSGTGCGNQVPTADCVSAACACDGFSFALTPTGSGTFMDVPAPGGVSNPDFADAPPWGGTDFGCLLAGELNSHWIVFTIATSGTLEFSFGQNSNGGQFGFYDWAMWPYNGTNVCSDIASDLLPPARCQWNATSIGGTGLATVIPTGGDAGNYGPALNVVAGQQFIICLSNYSYVTANVVLDFFGTAGIQCASVLANEFIELSGQVSRGHLLSWNTTGDRPCVRYELQRSSNGQVWELIEWTPGSQQLQWHVHQPFYGDSYYRIKGFHLDESFLFSNTIFLEHLPSELIVFPNPGSDRIIVRGKNYEEIRVVDQQGKWVYGAHFPESGELQLATAEWPSGVYCVTSLYQNEMMSKRFLITH